MRIRGARALTTVATDGATTRLKWGSAAAGRPAAEPDVRPTVFTFICLTNWHLCVTRPQLLRAYIPRGIQ